MNPSTRTQYYPNWRSYFPIDFIREAYHDQYFTRSSPCYHPAFQREGKCATFFSTGGPKEKGCFKIKNPQVFRILVDSYVRRKFPLSNVRPEGLFIWEFVHSEVLHHTPRSYENLAHHSMIIISRLCHTYVQPAIFDYFCCANLGGLMHPYLCHWHRYPSIIIILIS